MRNKAVPIVLTSLISLIAVSFGVSLYSTFTDVTRATTSLNAQPVALTQPTVAPQPATDSSPVLASQPAVVEAAPATTQASAPIAPAPAPTYIYSEVIRAAGIASSDDGYVTDMVLNDHGWRVYGPNTWSHANQANEGNSEPLVWNIGRVNHYVIATYGSWSAAHDAWVSGGDF